MNWSASPTGLFKVTRTEAAILTAASSAKTIREISAETSISRTGIVYRIGQLMQRGLIEQVRTGPRTYLSIDESGLNRRIVASSLPRLRSAASKGARVKAAQGAGEYIIHIGLDEVIPAYQRVASTNKNGRIRAIQHHRSWKELTRKIRPDQLIEFNASIVRNRIILDGVLNESAYKEYVEEIRKDPREQSRLVESLGGRMADYTVFPDEYFDQDAEIWIYRDTTLIISWKHETATEIRNQSITGFFRDMFDLMKASGKKIDHNQMIRAIKKSTEKTTARPTSSSQ